VSDQLPINHVRVGDRHRKDFGDVQALADSIKELGLLAPIVVTDDNALVAGHRRLEACRLLGWPTVPVRRVRQIKDAVTILKAERDENTCRKDFTPSEAVALGLALEELERPKSEDRKAEGLKRGQAAPVRANGHHGSDRATTRDVVAPAVGLAPRTYARARNVVLATDDPDPKVAEAAREAVAEMDATGNVSAAERKVKAARGQLTVKDKIDQAVANNPKTRDGMAAKIARANEMASEGFTSRQIADALGYASTESFKNFCREQGITVPADAVVGRSRTHDSNRIVEEAAITLEGLALSISLVEDATLDPARVEQWATSFESSLRSLNRFHKHMKEMARVQQ
jgi:ParB-like chromosome segregation protein Spo0J